MIKIVLTLLLLVSLSCKNSVSSSKSDEDNAKQENTISTDDRRTDDGESIEDSGTKKYPDGAYCATVEYNNPNTGTQSSYTLTVEVEDGELTRINWPNGGWLDDSHFTPQELDEEGSVNFTSDKGYEYTVTVDSKGPCSYSTPNAVSPSQAEEQHLGEEDGYVIWSQGGCDYVIIDIDNWYVVAENGYGANLSKGDHVRGKLTTFGYEKFYNISNRNEEEVYVDNYYSSKSSAMDEIVDKCDLNQDQNNEQ